MTKTIKISELPEFDLAEILKTDEDVANYLAFWKKTIPPSFPMPWVSSPVRVA